MNRSDYMIGLEATDDDGSLQTSTPVICNCDNQSTNGICNGRRVTSSSGGDVKTKIVCLKQIELNTMSAGASGLAHNINKLHRSVIVIHLHHHRTPYDPLENSPYCRHCLNLCNQRSGMKDLFEGVFYWCNQYFVIGVQFQSINAVCYRWQKKVEYGDIVIPASTCSPWPQNVACLISRFHEESIANVKVSAPIKYTKQYFPFPIILIIDYEILNFDLDALKLTIYS